MQFTPEQWVKIIGIIVGLLIVIVGAIFTVNKRSHKIGDINGDGNTVNNGDGNTVNKKP